MSNPVPHPSHPRTWRALIAAFWVAPLALMVVTGVSPRAFAAPPFLPPQGSTSPTNGDLNPYGLALVP